MIEIMERRHLTFYEYMAEPDWVIALEIEKMKIEGKLAEQARNA